MSTSRNRRTPVEPSGEHAEAADREERRHGRHATSPAEIPAPGLRDVLWRVYDQLLQDRVTLIAAGATYYIILSVFPGMGVLTSLYGLIADPSDIPLQIGFLKEVLPPGAFDLLLPQLEALARKGHSELSFAFVTSLAVAFWSATSGIKALFDAMNVAYGEEEKRSFVRLNLQAFAFMLAAVATAVVLVAIVGLAPAAMKALYLEQWTETLARWARWPFVLFVTLVATVLLYRYGPSREKAKLRWLTWGAAVSSLAWAAATIGFSAYLLNFANYNATYGTLGALIGFMIWIWLSMTIFIVGAELNAELEHQTRCDSTTGAPLPMGNRGAVMADTLGKTVD